MLTAGEAEQAAPIESPAESAREATTSPAGMRRSPNPEKAPWYFLGPADWLVYYDPWFAGTQIFFVAFGVALLMVIAVPLVLWRVLRGRGKQCPGAGH
jgi:hypothetical protein